MLELVVYPAQVDVKKINEQVDVEKINEICSVQVLLNN